MDGLAMARNANANGNGQKMPSNIEFHSFSLDFLAQKRLGREDMHAEEFKTDQFTSTMTKTHTQKAH
jgi:hypothetical protein